MQTSYPDTSSVTLSQLNHFITQAIGDQVPLAAQMIYLIADPDRPRYEARAVLAAADDVGIDPAESIRIAAVLDLIAFALEMHEGLALDPEDEDGLDPAMAVLAADFLYTRAFQIVAGMESITLAQLLSDGTTRAAEAAVLANQYQRDPGRDPDKFREATRQRQSSLLIAGVSMVYACAEHVAQASPVTG
ncbi:hypothetical protein [Stenotrophomonas maltophilia]|uniref:hypothetical protein n=1 Tax=Stenotrophomonas maltophilia TaxID=40324 RepID=UPI003D7E8FDB